MSSSTACAKFILGGEHSVVVRGRALSFPLTNTRLIIDIPSHSEKAPLKKLIVNGIERSPEEHSLVQNLCLRVGADFAPIYVDIKSHIPIGAGLGSSAALSVAFARHFHPNATPEEIAQWALKGEELFHQRPSGIDPYTISIEAPIVFSGLNRSFRKLNCEAFFKSQLRFALFDSGQTHKTSEVQASVEKTKSSTPLIFEDLMDALSTNVESMVKEFEAGHGTALGRLMNDSHFRLIQLGVSNDAIQTMATRIQMLSGCHGVKITGAGCGGFLLGLFDKDSALNSSDGASLRPSFLWPSID